MRLDNASIRRALARIAGRPEYEAAPHVGSIVVPTIQVGDATQAPYTDDRYFTTYLYEGATAGNYSSVAMVVPASEETRVVIVDWLAVRNIAAAVNYFRVFNDDVANHSPNQQIAFLDGLAPWTSSQYASSANAAGRTGTEIFGDRIGLYNYDTLLVPLTPGYVVHPGRALTVWTNGVNAAVEVAFGGRIARVIA